METEDTFLVKLGYLKRPSSVLQRLPFEIIITDETAKRNTDFFLNLFSSQDLFAELLITFALDGTIEPDETFLLGLRYDSNHPIEMPSGPNVFYRLTIRLTIVDGNGIYLAI